MFIDHETGRKASFTRRSQTPITAADNYRYNHGGVNGLWDRVLSDRLGASHHTYHANQLLICDNLFFSGFFISGYTHCYKRCHWWCADRISRYFRTSSTNPGYKGVAFNENGHRLLSNRLISVGLR